MKTIKIDEAEGQVLDWLVAKCEGKNGVLHDDGITRCIVVAAPSGVYKGIWKPTINWSQGGPIIEREKISIEPYVNHLGNWRSTFTTRTKQELRQYGSTPLIAAMRCYIVSKLGDYVDIPDILEEKC